MDFSLCESFLFISRALFGSSTIHTNTQYGDLNAKVDFMCSLNVVCQTRGNKKKNKTKIAKTNFYFLFREIKVAGCWPRCLYDDYK